MGADPAGGTDVLWESHMGEGPIMATAVHAGHGIRDELIPLLAIDEAVRAREEDPYTDRWARMLPTWLVPTRSRFEVDLNRARHEAIYESAEASWGLEVWRQSLTDGQRERSLSGYDAFYGELDRMLAALVARHGSVVVFDLHSYNHRRAGAHAPAADPVDNPDVNVGTGSLDRDRFGPLVDRFMADLGAADVCGRRLDVRENVKFRGRRIAAWAHERFHPSVCVLALELKKTFMDEWTGVGDVGGIEAIGAALTSTVPGVLRELDRLSGYGGS